MDLRVYEVLVELNQELEQALASPNILGQLGLGFPDYVGEVRTNLSELRAYANNHFACNIAKKEQEEENRFCRVRRKRERAEEGPHEIYLELKSLEGIRHECGLPSRAVILLWTQADDERILVMQTAASSTPPHQPDQSRTTGDAEQGHGKGVTPT